MSGRPHRPGQLAAALAAASLAASPVLAQANAVGVNAAIRNKVEIRHAADGKVRPAVLRARVLLNDVVRTEAASQLQILLLDRTTFTVGATSLFVIVQVFSWPAATVMSPSASQSPENVAA